MEEEESLAREEEVRRQRELAEATALAVKAEALARFLEGNDDGIEIEEEEDHETTPVGLSGAGAAAPGLGEAKSQKIRGSITPSAPTKRPKPHPKGKSAKVVISDAEESGGEKPDEGEDELENEVQELPQPRAKWKTTVRENRAEVVLPQKADRRDQGGDA